MTEQSGSNYYFAILFAAKFGNCLSAELLNLAMASLRQILVLVLFSSFLVFPTFPTSYSPRKESTWIIPAKVAGDNGLERFPIHMDVGILREN